MKINSRFKKPKKYKQAPKNLNKNYDFIVAENEKHNFTKKVTDFYNKTKNFKNKEFYAKFINNFFLKIDLLNDKYFTNKISKKQFLDELGHKRSQLEVLTYDIKTEEDMEKYIKFLLKSEK